MANGYYISNFDFRRQIIGCDCALSSVKEFFGMRAEDFVSKMHFFPCYVGVKNKKMHYYSYDMLVFRLDIVESRVPNTL